MDPPRCSPSNRKIKCTHQNKWGVTNSNGSTKVLANLIKYNNNGLPIQIDQPTCWPIQSNQPRCRWPHHPRRDGVRPAAHVRQRRGAACARRGAGSVGTERAAARRATPRSVIRTPERASNPQRPDSPPRVLTTTPLGVGWGWGASYDSQTDLLLVTYYY